MENDSFKVERAIPSEREVLAVVGALRRDLRSRFVPRGRFADLRSPILMRAAELRWRLTATARFTSPHGVFLIARGARDDVIGCGGLCRHDDRTGEIRRMYVHPDMRGRGVARELLAALLRAASELGYERIRLETGDRQTEALNFYRRAGFEPIPPWGRFAANAHSRCFELSLRNPDKAIDPRHSP